MRDSYLFLENGKCFKGKQIGKQEDVYGELCFNTSMAGYQEIFTDPSYAGQIVTMTSSHIGNTGINELDLESKKVHLKGIICRNLELTGSNFRKEEELNEFLDKQNIGISYGMDTRSIVRSLRDKGAMMSLITSKELNPQEAIDLISKKPKLSDQDLVSQVSCQQSYGYSAEDLPNEYFMEKHERLSLKLAVIDCGIKQNILRCLFRLGFDLKVFPSKTMASEIEAYGPDGLFISNGPGDPQKAENVIALAKHFHNKLPILGICLGMQIIGLMKGAKTFKLKFGHRGANHPVKDLRNGKMTITSQNHGYAISEEGLPTGLEVSHKNWNDFTIAGICCADESILAVQHHPEASPGPHDALGVFYEFKQIVQNFKVS